MDELGRQNETEMRRDTRLKSNESYESVFSSGASSSLYTIVRFFVKFSRKNFLNDFLEDFFSNDSEYQFQIHSKLSVNNDKSGHFIGGAFG